MNINPPRPPAFAVNDAVFFILEKHRITGTITGVLPPDHAHVTHRYILTTSTGNSGLILAEPQLQRLPARDQGVA